jgi:hypothetical protein
MAVFARTIDMLAYGIGASILLAFVAIINAAFRPFDDKRMKEEDYTVSRALSSYTTIIGFCIVAICLLQDIGDILTK